MIRDGVQLDSVVCGDALETLRTMESNSIDALVCDPPSGIHFMARSWDHDKGGRDAWIAWLASIMQEAKRCLKPGAHALVWALPRTSHWTATALEDAGFEIRDCVYHVFGTDTKVQSFLASLNDEQRSALAELVESQAAPSAILHVFGSGFPKSTAIDKQIDKRKDWKALHRLQGKIKEARLSLGLSQSEVARRAGLIAPHESLGGGGFMWFETGLSLPTKNHYLKIKDALYLDNECDEAFDEAEREVIGERSRNGKPPQYMWGEADGQHWNETAPATELAKQYAGYGTALKPAVENWILCRKPLSEKSIAENVLKWGVGGLAVDKCRVDGAAGNGHWTHKREIGNGTTYHGGGREEVDFGRNNPAGKRFPSHLLLSHTLLCDENECFEGCPILELSRQSGQSTSRAGNRGRPWSSSGSHEGWKRPSHEHYGDGYGGYTDQGSAARFFQQFHPATELGSQSDLVPYIYAPKASRAERNRGCEVLPKSFSATMNDGIGKREHNPKEPNAWNGNHHPCVKSLQLMRYLVRLITPPDGIVLDCFAGSGSTLVSCVYEGLRFIGIEQDESYVEIARCRVQYALQEVGCG